MKVKNLCALVGLSMVVLGACAASTNATRDQLSKRASFDLDCPGESLEFVEIDARTTGVRGCDQRATYVESCKPCANGYVGCECSWILNTDSK